MAATILNSPRAVEMSIYIVSAFVQLRELLTSNKELAKRLDELEVRIEKKQLSPTLFRLTREEAELLRSQNAILRSDGREQSSGITSGSPQHFVSHILPLNGSEVSWLPP